MGKMDKSDPFPLLGRRRLFTGPEEKRRGGSEDEPSLGAAHAAPELGRRFQDVTPAPQGGLEGHSPASEVMPVVRKWGEAARALEVAEAKVAVAPAIPEAPTPKKLRKSAKKKKAVVPKKRARAIAAKAPVEPAKKGRGRPASDKPWEKDGIPRRTWFAREAAKKKALAKAAAPAPAVEDAG